MRSAVTFRQATSADLETYYGAPPARTMKAWVALVDEKPIGIAGLIYRGATPWYLFSDVKPQMARHRKAVIAGGRMVLRALRGVPAVALSDNPKSAKLLRFMGLTFLGQTAEGDLYEWGG